jgi:hypothetical protein
MVCVTNERNDKEDCKQAVRERGAGQTDVLPISGDEDDINIKNIDLFFARSTDTGSTFETPINLSNNNSTKISYDPQVHVSDNHLHVVWVETYLSEAFDVFEASETSEPKQTNLVLSTMEINNSNNSTKTEAISTCNEDIKYGYNDYAIDE